MSVVQLDCEQSVHGCRLNLAIVWLTVDVTDSVRDYTSVSLTATRIINFTTKYYAMQLNILSIYYCIVSSETDISI